MGQQLQVSMTCFIAGVSYILTVVMWLEKCYG